MEAAKVKYERIIPAFKFQEEWDKYHTRDAQGTMETEERQRSCSVWGTRMRAKFGNNLLRWGAKEKPQRVGYKREGKTEEQDMEIGGAGAENECDRD